MEPDLKIIIGLLSLVCLMWAGGIWFICSFYKCDHDCIYCGDSAEDCPFCRKRALLRSVNPLFGPTLLQVPAILSQAERSSER